MGEINPSDEKPSGEPVSPDDQAPEKTRDAQLSNAFDILEKHLNERTENQGAAYMITGAWGSGKTYFWDAFAKKLCSLDSNKQNSSDHSIASIRNYIKNHSKQCTQKFFDFINNKRYEKIEDW